MPTSMELDINGPVHVVGHGGEGRPILLVHGLGGSHLNWSAVAEPLTEFGSVRAIDLIGFGYTPLAGRSSAVESQCDLVVAYLREHVDIPAVLIGNSMGGLISMLVAEAAPELVDSLVLVDPALPVVRPRLDASVLSKLALPLVPGLGNRAYALSVEDPEKFMDETFKIVFADRSRLRPEDRDLALAMAHERTTMPWAGEAFADAARSIFRIVLRGRSFARRVGEIEAPGLVVHGDKDRLVDIASARWLIKQRPGWRLEEFEGVGHVPQLESPDRFLEIVGAWLVDQNAEAAAT